MKTQKFGVEIELVDISKAEAVKAMAEVFGTNRYSTSSNYAMDTQGRQWKAVFDGSLNSASGKSAEIVTPILGYEDIELLQQVVRKLREKGAKANESCGIHVHVDATAHTAKSLWNLVNIMSAKEDILYKALQVKHERERYCAKTDKKLVKKINTQKPQTLQKVKEIWYEGNISRSSQHYDRSRYHAINLHSLWQGKGIEFRCFNGTTHAGKIKAYIQLCLAISHQALTQKSAGIKKTKSTNEKFTFRTWLLHLGLIGKEFETARYHLLANLDGNAAYRYENTRGAV